jgi:hypothetical protein
MKTDSRIYGRYVLRAGKLGTTFVARAFLRDASTPGGIIAEATGKTAEAALDTLQEMLSEQDRARRAAHRPSEGPRAEVASEEEYREALAALRVTDAQWKMLRAHALAGPKGLSAGELADAADFANYSSANLQYGKLGRDIAAYLNLDLPESKGRKREDVSTAALADEGTPNEKGHFVWVMHPELAAAVT